MNLIIGEQVSTDQFGALPLGSRLRDDNYTYHVTEDGIWRKSRNGGGMAYSTKQPAILEALGDFESYDLTTVQRAKQRLSTFAYGQARTHSVNLTPVTRALEKMGIRPDDRYVLRLGMFLHYYDTDLMARMPNGTIIQWGDPESVDTMKFMVIENGGRQDLIGNTTLNPYGFRVVAFPEGTQVEEWLPPREDEADRLLMFRMLLVDVGWKAKSEAGWCGVFEDTLNRINLSRVDTMPWTSRNFGGRIVGTINEVNSDELPVGATLITADASYVKTQEHTHGWMAVTNPGEFTQITPHGYRPQDLAPQAVWLPITKDDAPKMGDPVTNEQVGWCMVGSKFKVGDVEYVLNNQRNWTAAGQEINWMDLALDGAVWVEFVPWASPLAVIKSRRALPSDDTPLGSLMHYSAGNWYLKAFNEERAWIGNGGTMDTRHRNNAFDRTTQVWALTHLDDATYPLEWAVDQPGRSTRHRGVDQLNGAPVGVIVACDDGTRWTCDHIRLGTSWWTSPSYDGFRPAADIPAGRWHARAAVQVGIARTQIAKQPLGTTYVTDRRGFYQKVESDKWQGGNGTLTDAELADWMAANNPRLLRLGFQVEAPAPTDDDADIF